jgi:SSS family solute:Na+ symporter
VGLLITIAFTTILWMLTAFLGPATDRKTLIAFYRKIKPFGPGWTVIREEAGVSVEEARATGQNIPLGLLGWVSGCITIWSALFTVGNFLYGRMNYALVLFGVFVISGLVLLHVMNRYWSSGGGQRA